VIHLCQCSTVIHWCQTTVFSNKNNLIVHVLYLGYYFKAQSSKCLFLLHYGWSTVNYICIAWILYGILQFSFLSILTSVINFCIFLWRQLIVTGFLLLLLNGLHLVSSGNLLSAISGEKKILINFRHLLMYKMYNVATMALKKICKTSRYLLWYFHNYLKKNSAIKT